MSIPREFIDLLLTKVDIVDLINTHIPLRKKSGSNYFARCPFHNEKSGSFSVSQPKQFYYCFGCGAHGNALDFLMQHERLNFPEAVENLARSLGMEVPNSAKPSKKDATLPGLYDLVQQAATAYYESMCKSPRAIGYLKARGISGVIAQQFQLGYAPNSFHHILDIFGKSEPDKAKLAEVGLIVRKQEGNGFYDRFRDRIIFPIMDYRGRVIGFGGRIIDAGEPKYLNSPETPLFQKGHELYGLYQALKANRQLQRILIVEGYMDVIALFQHNITYAVATLGTATTAHHLTKLFRYTSEIIFCFDGDDAGKNAATRALQILFPLIHDSLQVRFLFLPEGEDPDSLVRKEGKENFKARVANATSLSTFFLQTIAQQTNLNTLEGRARFASLALAEMKQLPEGIFHNMLLEEIAKKARLESSQLMQQLPSASTVTHMKVASSADNAKTKLPLPMRLAMGLLVQYPRLAGLIPPPQTTIKVPGYEFLLKLITLLQQKPNLTTGALMEYWRGQKEEGFIAKLAHWEHMVPEEGVDNEFLGAFRQITLLAFDEEINRLLAKAAQSGLSDPEKLELADWISKKKDLVRVSA